MNKTIFPNIFVGNELCIVSYFNQPYSFLASIIHKFYHNTVSYYNSNLSSICCVVCSLVFSYVTCVVSCFIFKAYLPPVSCLESCFPPAINLMCLTYALVLCPPPGHLKTCLPSPLSLSGHWMSVVCVSCVFSQVFTFMGFVFWCFCIICLSRHLLIVLSFWAK